MDLISKEEVLNILKLKIIEPPRNGKAVVSQMINELLKNIIKEVKELEVAEGE